MSNFYFNSFEFEQDISFLSRDTILKKYADIFLKIDAELSFYRTLLKERFAWDFSAPENLEKISNYIEEETTIPF